MTRTIVAADVGGTHARFALAEVADGRVTRLGEPITLATADHASFEAAWQEFCRIAGIDPPDALGMAFAGPIGADVLKLTNNPWIIRSAMMEERLGVRQTKIVNDFGAIAHAVAQLGPESFDRLCGPDGPTDCEGVTTVIGPGTGLGVALLLRRATSYGVIETEGGHIEFAPLDPLEDQILAHLRRNFGRVSAERIASGSGLANLYNALSSIEGKVVQDPDDRRLWAVALEGSDPLATVALDRFFLSLGAIAGDLALAHGANEVVIAGGLSYRLKDRFASSGFCERFIIKGRFERRMESIPVRLINHPQPGLYGAAAAFAREFA